MIDITKIFWGFLIFYLGRKIYNSMAISTEEKYLDKPLEMRDVQAGGGFLPAGGDYAKKE